MDWIRFGLLGLGTGALYALTALGINVVYRASGVINFSAGAIGALCAYIFYSLKDTHGLPWGLCMVIVLLLGAALGAVIHQIVIERMRTASAVMKLVATLGVLTLLQGICEVAFPNSGLATPFLPVKPVKITSSLVISEDRIILVAIGLGLGLILLALYRFTTFGLATAAVAENRRASSALGWSPRVIELSNWVVGGVLSALAGVLLAPIVSLNVTTLVLLVIPALAAALIGGFTSFPLTIIGGLLIGVVESELSRYNSHIPGISEAVPFIIIILVIIAGGRARPTRADLPTRLPSLSAGRISPLWLIIGAALALLGILTLSDNWIDSITYTLLAMLMVFSLIVVTGYGGQISLAQWSLAGFGAWVAGRLVAGAGWPFWAALIVGVVATIPAGLIVALPALRTRGVNLAVATIGLGLVIQDMIFGNQKLTGGINGTQVGDPHLFGVDINALDHPGRYAIVVLVAAVLVGLVVSNLRRGRTGLRLIAVRSNERAAAALGISTFGVKLYAFAVAAAIAGIGGVLAGFKSPLIVFDQFTVFGSIQYVVFAFVGGIGWLSGAIFGSTLAPGALPNQLVNEIVNVDKYVSIIGGASIILVLLANPDGIASAHHRFVEGVRSRLRGKDGRLAGTASSARKQRNAVVIPPRERKTATLSIQGLTIRYGGFTALNRVSFDVEPGKITGLIGPNGAGKTTLLDAVTGFAKAAEGSVRWGDDDITSWSPTRRARAGLGRSWQAVELFEELSVYDNLRAAIDRQNMKHYAQDLVNPGRPTTTAMLQTVIEEFDLTEHLDAMPSSLPQGLRRLVGIARAMLNEPDVLFLDEPAAGLDHHESEEFGTLLRRIARDYQIAVVLVEHDVPLVMSVCDHIVVLNFGKIIAAGTPDEIRPNADVIAAYLGEPEADEDSAAPSAASSLAQDASLPRSATGAGHQAGGAE